MQFLCCTVEMLEIDIGKHQVSKKRRAWVMQVEEDCGQSFIMGTMQLTPGE